MACLQAPCDSPHLGTSPKPPAPLTTIHAVEFYMKGLRKDHPTPPNGIQKPSSPVGLHAKSGDTLRKQGVLRRERAPGTRSNCWALDCFRTGGVLGNCACRSGAYIRSLHQGCRWLAARDRQSLGLRMAPVPVDRLGGMGSGLHLPGNEHLSCWVRFQQLVMASISLHFLLVMFLWWDGHRASPHRHPTSDFGGMPGCWAQGRPAL